MAKNPSIAAALEVAVDRLKQTDAENQAAKAGEKRQEQGLPMI